MVWIIYFLRFHDDDGNTIIQEQDGSMIPSDMLLLDDGVFMNNASVVAMAAYYGDNDVEFKWERHGDITNLANLMASTNRYF